MNILGHPASPAEWETPAGPIFMFDFFSRSALRYMYRNAQDERRTYFTR